MIDALFGSKTRVKLLHLFLNNPGKSFYVREITRLIDEQINSVRRELSNMLEVGVITSDSADNKLYYEVDQQYEFYTPFRAIFANQKVTPAAQSMQKSSMPAWQRTIKDMRSVRVAIISGALVTGSASPVDLLLVGDISSAKSKTLVASIEKAEGRELSYSVLTYDEFYYRLSVRDKFINSILTNKPVVLVDSDNILKLQ